MSKSKQDVILVFGENDNDRSALIEIAKAVAPGAMINYEKRHKPLILVSNQERPETVRSTANDIKKLVKVAQIRFNVLAIIAHRDCDAVEPAHVVMAHSVKDALKGIGVKHVIAATPAFELEAWWLLFPSAVKAVCPSWEHLPHTKHNVGMITDAKEHLRRLLRPKDATKRTRCPDYSESDSVRIARKVREMDLVREISQHQSGSLIAFIQGLDGVFSHEPPAASAR